MADIWGNAEIIYAYTRAQAIADGVLVDVTKIAQEAGIKIPVAVTRSVWDKYIGLPENYKGVQSESGRLWDVVWILRCAMLSATTTNITIALLYRLHVRKVKRVRGSWVDAGGERTPPLVTLKAVSGPGDNAERVITVMLPDED